MRAAAGNRTPTLRDVAALSGGWPVPPWRPGAPFRMPPLNGEMLAAVAPTSATAAVVRTAQSHSLSPPLISLWQSDRGPTVCLVRSCDEANPALATFTAHIPHPPWIAPQVGAIESLMTVRLVNEMVGSVVGTAERGTGGGGAGGTDAGGHSRGAGCAEGGEGAGASAQANGSAHLRSTAGNGAADAPATGDEESSESGGEDDARGADVPPLLASALEAAGEALRPGLVDSGDSAGESDMRRRSAGIPADGREGTRSDSVERESEQEDEGRLRAAAAERAGAASTSTGAHPDSIVSHGWRAALRRRGRARRPATASAASAAASDGFVAASAAVGARLEKRLLEVAALPGNPYIELVVRPQRSRYGPQPGRLHHGLGRSPAFFIPSQSISHSFLLVVFTCVAPPPLLPFSSFTLSRPHLPSNPRLWGSATSSPVSSAATAGAPSSGSPS